MIKNTIAFFFAAITLAILPASSFAQKPIDRDAPPLKSVMQLKLDYSKLILEGLAMEDYQKITKNSQALSLLSLESGWKILQTEEYMKQSRDFRRTADVITDSSREKNLDRAALGYVALTVRCVECHGYLRKKHPELATITQPKKTAPKKKKAE